MWRHFKDQILPAYCWWNEGLKLPPPFKICMSKINLNELFLLLCCLYAPFPPVQIWFTLDLTHVLNPKKKSLWLILTVGMTRLLLDLFYLTIYIFFFFWDPSWSSVGFIGETRMGAVFIYCAAIQLFLISTVRCSQSLNLKILTRISQDFTMQFFWQSCWSPKNWAKTQEPRRPASRLHLWSDSPGFHQSAPHPEWTFCILYILWKLFYTNSFRCGNQHRHRCVE